MTSEQSVLILFRTRPTMTRVLLFHLRQGHVWKALGMKQSLYLWWQLGSLRPNLLHSTHFYNLHLNVTNTVTISPSSDSLKIQCMPKLHGLQTVQTHILYLLNKRGYIEEPVTFTSNTTRLIRNQSLSALTTKVVSVGSESQTQAPWIPKRLHKSYWN